MFQKILVDVNKKGIEAIRQNDFGTVENYKNIYSFEKTTPNITEF